MKNLILKNWKIIVIVVLAFCLLKSCGGNSMTETQNAKLLKSKIDSLEYLSNRNLDKFHDAEMVIKVAVDSIRVLNKQSKLIETKLYQLQKKTSVKPIYIENVVDCNETIKAIYDQSTLKDSVCNSVIAEKNKVIEKVNYVISADSAQKRTLNHIIEMKDLHISVQDGNIANQKKQVKKEKNKKTFWQIVAGIISIFSIIK
jgi:hypothetical protein